MKVSRLKRRILKALHNEFYDDNFTPGDLKSLAAPSCQSNNHYIIKTLLRDGIVERLDYGYYRLTELGKETCDDLFTFS